MTDNQKKQYLKDGYTVAKGILTEPELATIREALVDPFAHLCRKHGIHAPEANDWGSVHQSLRELKSVDLPGYMNALKISQNDGRILGIPAHVRLRDFLRDIGLQSPTVALKPFPILIADDLHIEGGYNVRPFHQEWPVMQGSLDGAITWIPVHDITPVHNALELIPGSHLRGVRAYERTKCGTGVAASDLPRTGSIRLEPKAGDVIVFSAFTIHRTSPTGGALRGCVTIRFNNLADPSFIERGYPDPSKIEIDRQPLGGFVPPAFPFGDPSSH